MSGAENEIIEQHRLIEAMRRGDAAEATLTEFAGVLTPRFALYLPDGGVAVREDVVSGLARSRGSAPDLTVTISAVRLLADDTRTVVATYEEHQEAPEASTARRSTVVFVRDPAARHGLRWEHLHETWMRGSAE